VVGPARELRSSGFASVTSAEAVAISRILRAAFSGSAEGPIAGKLHAAILSSLSAPRMTILSSSSGNGRCNAFASSHGARIQTSRSSSVVKIIGMALGWIGSMIVFAFGTETFPASAN
jgi:hypothetical protein